MSTSEPDDKMLDQLISYAAQKQIDDFCARLPCDADLDAQVSLSPSFQARMDHTFKSVRRRQFYGRLGKSALKIAAAIVAFLAVSTTVIFSVEAFRIPFLNLFSETKKESTTITVEEKAVDYQQFSEKIKGLYLPSYVPDGYSIKSIERFATLYVIKFTNDKSAEISLKALPGGTTLGVDSEDGNAEHVTVNDAPAQYFEKETEHKLVFKLKENAFMLISVLSKKEMIHIAESMKLY